MFELKEICKSFKDGEKEKIIFKDCSYKFPEKGMVFIVGKSGCGKSTLLNLLAGFDCPDKGEILYLRKDINNLSDKESVAYFQHEIGFVFQEYNLIDSLNVFENIAISSNVDNVNLEETVSELLQKVGMSGYGYRKISQLSGGQKQRVAIARALGGNVKTILCDEPTGALDEENSRQVFECLKEISNSSLVIIVSHDLVFAQKYGDIILTIEEGKLVSSKKSYEDKITSNKGFDLAIYKKKMYIGKLGVSLAFCKKVRFIIAILLMTIALSGFGLSSSLLTFTKSDAVLKHMEENDLTYLSYQKVLDYEIDNHSFSQAIKLSEKDIDDIQNYTGLKVLPKYSYFNQKIVNIHKNNSNLYLNSINGFCEINPQVIEELGFNIYGNLPSNDDEVVITDYMYQVFQRDGYRSPTYEIYEISSYDDIIGKDIQLSAYDNFVEYDVFKIVGILNTNFNENMFGDVDNETAAISYELVNQIDTYFETSLEQTIFLKEGYYNRNIKTYNEDHYTENIGIIVNNSFISYSKNFNELSYVLPASTNVIYKNDSVDNLGIILPLESFETNENQCLNLYTIYYAESVFDTIETEFKNDYGEESTYRDYASYLLDCGFIDTKYLAISKNKLTKWCVNKFIEQHRIFELFNFSIGINANISNTLQNLEIQGITFVESQKAAYLSMENFNKLVDSLSYYNNDILMCYLPLSKVNPLNKKLIELKGLNVSDQPNYILDTTYKVSKAYIELNNLSTFLYDSINDGTAFYKTILIIAGGALLVFSILFMFFDIKGIIKAKEKEIGILKSLGVDVKSVITSFIIYSILFTLLASLFSNITCFVANNVINQLINKAYFCEFKFIHYSYIQWLTSLLMPFVICSIISIISIVNTYKKKTIDLIR